jgi:hypothetical protein
MNERKLDHCSRINTADEGTLERSVGPNMFESLDDGLVSKPVTPSAPAGSAAFVLEINTGKVRDIVLDRFVRSPHRHCRSSNIQPLLVLLAGKIP